MSAANRSCYHRSCGFCIREEDTRGIDLELRAYFERGQHTTLLKIGLNRLLVDPAAISMIETIIIYASGFKADEDGYSE